MNPQLCLMETGKNLHPFYRHGQLYFTFSTTPKAVHDYLFITRRLYIFPQEPCQMIIKVIFISSFIFGQHGFVHHAQCITCITLCSCIFTSHPFHLPCFRLFVPLFLHCISPARTENTVTLFCAEKKKKKRKETPLHQNISLQSTPLLEP